MLSLEIKLLTVPQSTRHDWNRHLPSEWKEQTCKETMGPSGIKRHTKADLLTKIRKGKGEVSWLPSIINNTEIQDVVAEAIMAVECLREGRSRL